MKQIKKPSMGVEMLHIHQVQCDHKKLSDVYKSCLKMIDFNTFTNIA